MKFMCDKAIGAIIGQRLSLSMAAPAKTVRAQQRRGLAGLLALSASVWLAGTPAMAAGDAEAGASKAYTCLGCHGIKHYINTYPSYHVPRIAGQHEEYLVAALQAYRAKTRSHPTMQANANLLSDQDIEDIAAWFAAQGINN